MVCCITVNYSMHHMHSIVTRIMCGISYEQGTLPRGHVLRCALRLGRAIEGQAARAGLREEDVAVVLLPFDALKCCVSVR